MPFLMRPILQYKLHMLTCQYVLRKVSEVCKMSANEPATFDGRGLQHAQLQERMETDLTTAG